MKPAFLCLYTDGFAVAFLPQAPPANLLVNSSSGDGKDSFGGKRMEYRKGAENFLDDADSRTLLYLGKGAFVACCDEWVHQAVLNCLAKREIVKKETDICLFYFYYPK